ncbi:HAD family hydrolase [bacterium]|nr:HAD family hydrolase [bacterium]
MSYYLDDTKIEIIREADLGKIKHALFDFDGTISLVRDGWQNVMVPIMVEILIDTQTNETEEELQNIVIEFVDRLTGKQTIYQMIQLREEVEKRGGIPLAPLEYKQMYNERLLPIVNDRIAKLEKEESDKSELLLLGSLDFLRKLRDGGVKLYLASGTDVEFVKHEADILGITPYFTGGIFGAIKEYKTYSKAMVIQKILEDYNLSGSQLLIVGDGFVEIENGKAVGAVAVGVASVENNIFGMNADKRVRLINAGADIIIPDYKDQDKLLEYLFQQR